MTTIQSILFDTKLVTVDDAITHWIFSATISISLFIITYIYYAAYLIYLATIKNRLNLRQESQQKLSVFTVDTDRNQRCFKQISQCPSPQQHWSAKLLLRYNIFSSMFVLCVRGFGFHDKHQILFVTWFGISTLIGIFVIITILYNKIKDILGCLVEVYMGVFIMMMNSIYPSIPNVSLLSVMVVAFITMHILSSFKLWIPLYLIHRTEGLLCIHYNSLSFRSSVHSALLAGAPLL